MMNFDVNRIMQNDPVILRGVCCERGLYPYDVAVTSEFEVVV